jgi:DNA-binding NarL/FixJ family response regulator
LRELKPDLAVIDLHLPFLSGIDVISTIHREIPAIRLVAITGLQSTEFIDGALAAGACAYLTKPGCLPEFPAAAAAVLNGHRYLTDAALNYVWDTHAARVSPRNHDELTKRQREVVGLVAAGMSNKEMSVQLSISVRTVEKFRAEAMENLGIHTSAELVRYAVKAGMVDNDRGSIYHTLPK